MLDEGIRVHKLDARTGARIAGSRFYGFDPRTGAEKPGRNTKALAGILSADGTGIYMRMTKMDRDTLAEVPATAHFHSGMGLLDDSWFHRNYWTIADGMGGNYAVWWRTAGEAPSGRILVFDESTVYGFGRTKVNNRLTTAGKRGSPHHLFAIRRANGGGAGAGGGGRKRKSQKDPLWSREVPFMARAMVLAGDSLFVAGPRGDYRKPGAFEGAEGVVLAAVSTADGTTLAECPLDAVPVWDGMAAAGGRLYVALTDGSVVCLGAR
jgi:hypothetical protein